MPPPDQPLHPKGLSIPMTQTLTPRIHPLTLPQVIQPLQIPQQTMIWTILNPVKPSPLMTPPLSTSWTPIPLLTLSMNPTKGTVYFKHCRVADGRANGWLTDAPGPSVKGARTTNQFNWANSSSWKRGEEVVDGMSVVGTHCDAVLDASEKKWFPGVEPLP